MEFLWIPIVIAAIISLILLVAFICYRLTFYAKKQPETQEYPIPPGEIYEPYRETMVGWMKEARSIVKEELSITSFDGLKLFGRYYECVPGAVTEIMFHGYRGNAERDLCGGVQRCFALGRNALIVDQRACGKSQGNVISFGVNEYKDCLSWIDFAISHFNSEVKFILTGISMGASTVLMAAGNELPERVVGVLADCGYTSAKEIIKKVIKDMGLPANILYPFVRLGASVFGKFSLEEQSAIQSVKKSRLPIILFHGENDDFVPCEMSVRNFKACLGPKKLVIVPGAGHGLSYLVEPERYLNEVAQFFTQNGVPTNIMIIGRRKAFK